MVEWNETPLLIYNYQLTFVYAGNNKFLANRNKKKLVIQYISASLYAEPVKCTPSNCIWNLSFFDHCTPTMVS